MRRVDDREETQWLGGEAHVPPINRLPRFSVMRRWLASRIIPLLAGAAAAGVALGSLGTIGVIKAEHERSRRRIGEQSARTLNERSESMEQTRADERRVCDNEADAMGMGTILAAFGLGLLAGAVATLLTTPESGTSVRTRLKRGVETARQELDEIVGETKESWNLVSNDARKAVKQTATRVKEAAQVTKEALAEGVPPVRKTP